MPGYAPIRGYVWLTWGFRLAIPVSLYFAWRSLQADQYAMGAGVVVLAGAAFWGQDISRQLALGWVTDDFGERQKVLAADKAGHLHTQISRQQRLVLELQTKTQRRRSLASFGLAIATVVGMAFYLYQSNYADYSWWGKPAYWISLLVAGLLAIRWTNWLAMELLYLSGWQLMTGAKVIDQPGRMSGQGELQDQMAHGGARLATEVELRDAAAGNVKQSRLHDETF